MAEATSQEVARLRAASTDREHVLGELLDQHRARLRRMVDLRIDPRLRARVDASDVVQEAFLEIATRLEDYLADPRLPFYLWIRFITGQRLVALYRHHLGTQKRDAGRQVSLHPALPGASTVAMADQLLAGGTSPSGAAVRTELRGQLIAALDAMNGVDREVLVLRHFEQLGNRETALVLNIGETATSNRYVRALERLRGFLAPGPGPAPDAAS